MTSNERRARWTSGNSRSRRAGAPTRLGLAVIALAALLILTLLGPVMTFYWNTQDGGGSLFRQIGYIVIFIACAISIRPLHNPERLNSVPWPLLLVLGWCWLSMIWAIDPGIALRRLILASVIIWSVFTLIRQLGYERTLTMIRILLAVALVANFIALAMAPDLAVHQINDPEDTSLVGDWRGIMGHKNIAGLTSALTVLFFIFDAQKIPRPIQLSVVVAAGIFLVGSHSRTSIALCVGALLLGFIFSRYKRRYRGAAIILVVFIGIVGAWVQSVYSDPLLRTLNDPTAFTGRTQIWQALYQYHLHHRWFGSGYGSFWNIGDRSPILSYGQDWVRTVAQGHNGFLDLLVQVGIPGLVLTLVATLVWPLIQVLNARSTEGGRGALILATLLFCIAHNGSESSLMDRDMIGQVFLMIAIAMLCGLIRAEKRDGRLRMSTDALRWANRREERSTTSQPRGKAPA